MNLGLNIWGIPILDSVASEVVQCAFGNYGSLQKKFPLHACDLEHTAGEMKMELGEFGRFLDRVSGGQHYAAHPRKLKDIEGQVAHFLDMYHVYPHLKEKTLDQYLIFQHWDVVREAIIKRLDGAH
ncbi:unnamed protein product [Calypogeia fissa]